MYQLFDLDASTARACVCKGLIALHALSGVKDTRGGGGGTGLLMFASHVLCAPILLVTESKDAKTRERQC